MSDHNRPPVHQGGPGFNPQFANMNIGAQPFVPNVQAQPFVPMGGPMHGGGGGSGGGGGGYPRPNYGNYGMQGKVGCCVRLS